MKDAGRRSRRRPRIPAPSPSLLSIPEPATKPDAGPAKPSDASADTPVDAGKDKDPVTPTGDAPTEASASTMGPHTVKTYTNGYPDAPEYADSTMHYPEGLDGPLPAIAIVPGFVSAQSSIQKWGPFLASHGIVTLTIGTNSTSDQPPARAKALWGAIGTIKGENTREGSPLKGKLDLERLAIGGWSMGGGGTLIALGSASRAQGRDRLLPVESRRDVPEGQDAHPVLGGAQRPACSGAVAALLREHSQTSTPKMLWEKSNADHFANDPDNNMGAQGRYGLSWLKTFLAEDDALQAVLARQAAERVRLQDQREVRRAPA